MYKTGHTFTYLSVSGAYYCPLITHSISYVFYVLNLYWMLQTVQIIHK